MAAVSDQGVLRGPTPAPLGSMLVARGLLGEQDLAMALAEQEEGGRPLGEILVAKGFVSAAVIAQALATQHGGALKTEYGYALSFDSRIRPGMHSEPPVSPPSFQLDISPSEAAARDRRRAAPLDRSSELELELADAQRENRELRATVSKLEREAASLADERDSAQREAAVATARLSGFEAAVASLRAQLAAHETSPPS
jgi:hypothetical protein